MRRTQHADDETPQPDAAGDQSPEEGTDPDDGAEAPNPPQKGTREAPLGGI